MQEFLSLGQNKKLVPNRASSHGSFHKSTGSIKLPLYPWLWVPGQILLDVLQHANLYCRHGQEITAAPQSLNTWTLMRETHSSRTFCCWLKTSSWETQRLFSFLFNSFLFAIKEPIMPLASRQSYLAHLFCKFLLLQCFFVFIFACCNNWRW